MSAQGSQKYKEGVLGSPGGLPGTKGFSFTADWAVFCRFSQEPGCELHMPNGQGHIGCLRVMKDQRASSIRTRVLRMSKIRRKKQRKLSEVCRGLNWVEEKLDAMEASKDEKILVWGSRPAELSL